MNDYKELIERLRMFFNRYPGADEIKEAADAIEQLGRDNDVLTKERDKQNNYTAELHEEAANLIRALDSERNSADEWQHDYFELATKLRQLEEERDAAVADISLALVCSDVCKVCKHRFADDPTDCLECDELNPNGNFEWRGLEDKE